ncbi:MAG TPA: ABC transporter substrate-binding protein [Pirellulales bacterium]|nr:ABC transporter substrate-binding protein [Pirellulales bacterium]
MPNSRSTRRQRLSSNFGHGSPARLLLLLTCVVSPRATATAAEPPAKPIVLGMSTALSGPAEGLGQGVLAGVQAALDEVNRQGGIRGRQTRLIALDDGYEPNRTGPNMHRLIEQEGVVAVIGNVGTPTAVVAVPICNETKTLLFGAFTGAGVLRKTPPDRYVINYRASYAEETGSMVDALVKAGLQLDEIAFFTQRDAFGDSGFAGGVAALRRHGLKDETNVVNGRFERNTTAVEGALAEILNAKTPARAVIMVCPYAPAAKFIQLARGSGLKTLFLNVSFVGAENLAGSLGAAGEGVIVTEVVPHYESDLPLVSKYRAALAASNEAFKPSFTSLEGYVDARILLRALTDAAGPFDREGVVRAVEGLGSFDVGLGEPLQVGPLAHQASHQVWPTVIRDSKVRSMDWKDLKALLQ